jgi:hypothetical protein
MLVYSDKCSDILNDTNFKVCDFCGVISDCQYCGDIFCDQCGFESIICCSEHEEKLDFCKPLCKGLYKVMPGKCEVFCDIDYDGCSDDELSR